MNSNFNQIKYQKTKVTCKNTVTSRFSKRKTLNRYKETIFNSKTNYKKIVVNIN